MKIWAKTEQFSEGKFLVVRRDGSVPHWPHFVLGARDLYAPAALRAYADEASKDYRIDREYIQSIRELADDFERYRNEQGNGDPDAPPHRTDDENVISAMRHNPAIIKVTPDRGNAPKVKR